MKENQGLSKEEHDQLERTIVEVQDSNALLTVVVHRCLQDMKWGVQDHHPLKWLAILGEEFGEACKANLENKPDEYREEMCGIAAVAIAAVQCFDRNIKHNVNPP